MTRHHADCAKRFFLGLPRSARNDILLVRCFLTTHYTVVRNRSFPGSGQERTGSGQDRQQACNPAPKDGVIASGAWQSRKETLCVTGIGTRPCYSVRLPRCARNDILRGRCFLTTHYTVVRNRSLPSARRQARKDGQRATGKDKTDSGHTTRHLGAVSSSARHAPHRRHCEEAVRLTWQSQRNSGTSPRRLRKAFLSGIATLRSQRHFVRPVLSDNASHSRSQPFFSRQRARKDRQRARKDRQQAAGNGQREKTRQTAGMQPRRLVAAPSSARHAPHRRHCEEAVRLTWQSQRNGDTSPRRLRKAFLSGIATLRSQ